MRSTTPGGVEVDVTRVVVRVDDTGRIISIDEYVDTAPLVALVQREAG